MTKLALAFLTLICSAPLMASAADAPLRCLPGEPSADDVLNGKYPFPPSPTVEAHDDYTGFAKERLTKVPPPGVHPRILIGPDDLPELRTRLKETETGRTLLANLRSRMDAAVRTPGFWGSDLYAKLAAGDAAGAQQLLNEHHGMPDPVGHYQPFIGSCLEMESFDALVSEDAQKGKRAGKALATFCRMIQPAVENALSQPLGDDVWRVKVTGPTTGDWSSDQGLRELVGYHLLGYAYDFAYNHMSDDDRAAARHLIATITAGHVWMGARLPHHWRNWNWIMVGMGEPLLSLAIEGEEGYDPRVYKMGVQIARDYCTYAISPSGASTEAVGYTQFGFVWGAPFMVAAARRGDNLLVQSHHRAMIDWYLQTMEPYGKLWQSHGDGGVTGPAVWTMAMWKYFYPDDPKVDYLWQNALHAEGVDQLKTKIHQVEAMIWASDPSKDANGQPIDYANGEKLNAPLTWFDPIRSSLIARSGWSPDAAAVEFECRTDSVGASHEHADRGNFTFTALGRDWARESFRSIESRHHDCVLIDGLGQGFWGGPGKWLGLKDTGWALVAGCDAKDAYDWWWPKEILTEDPATFIRFKFPRWESFLPESETFHKQYAGIPLEHDPRQSVVAHFKGFEQGDPRMWDEDAWPVRLPHNPVQRAFRSLAFVRDGDPYLIIADDIQKDNHEHLYEWLMQTGPNTEMASIKDNDIILCDATVPRDADGVAKPKKGDRALLVRILQMTDADPGTAYQAKPSIRLEAFEKKDTTSPDGRSFGLDKRLVIPSRCVAPNFKILLFPMHAGDPLPTTVWDHNNTHLILTTRKQKDEITFTSGEGRTSMSIQREGKESAAMP